jgi:hypothetical protein
MPLELTGFFPTSERANKAVETLIRARFDMDDASLLTGEAPAMLFRKRVEANRWRRVVAGAAILGGIALVLVGVITAVTQVTMSSLAVASFVAIAGFLGGATGSYCARCMDEYSCTLLKAVVPRHRVNQAIRIARAAGGQFVEVRPMREDYGEPALGEEITLVRSAR